MNPKFVLGTESEQEGGVKRVRTVTTLQGKTQEVQEASGFPIP
jgi:hypothetical protein